MAHGERAGLFAVWGKTANFETEASHCGLKIERNQKLVLNDKNPIAAFTLNVSHTLMLRQ
jgi:hypothetical protein